MTLLGLRDQAEGWRALCGRDKESQVMVASFLALPDQAGWSGSVMVIFYVSRWESV